MYNRPKRSKRKMSGANKQGNDQLSDSDQEEGRPPPSRRTKPVRRVVRSPESRNPFDFSRPTKISETDKKLNTILKQLGNAVSYTHLTLPTIYSV